MSGLGNGLAPVSLLAMVLLKSQARRFIVVVVFLLGMTVKKVLVLALSVTVSYFGSSSQVYVIMTDISLLGEELKPRGLGALP